MTAAAVAELDESGRRIAKRVENVRQAKWAPTPPAMSALTLVAETGTAAAAPHLSLGQRVADRVLPSRPSAWEAHLRRLTSTTLENEGVDLVMAFHSVMGPGAPGTRTRYRTLTTWATTTSIAGHPDADVNLLALRDVCKISDTTERRTALLAPPPDRSAAESDMAAEGTAVVGVGVEAARVDVDALVTDATLSGRGIETLGRATRTTVRGAAAVATLAGLVALAGTGMLAAGGLAAVGRVAVMADMRRRLRADPALGAAAALEGVSVRREIGSASPQYHSAPWSTDRVDEVARDLKRKVPYIDPMQPQPLPDSYRSQPRPGLLTRLGQMRWVIGSAPARPTPTHARQPASSQPTDRVDRGPAAPALPTPSPTESRPPPAPPPAAADRDGSPARPRRPEGHDPEAGRRPLPLIAAARSAAAITSAPGSRLALRGRPPRIAGAGAGVEDVGELVHEHRRILGVALVDRRRRAGARDRLGRRRRELRDRGAQLRDRRGAIGRADEIDELEAEPGPDRFLGAGQDRGPRGDLLDDAVLPAAIGRLAIAPGNAGAIAHDQVIDIP